MKPKGVIKINQRKQRRENTFKRMTSDIFIDAEDGKRSQNQDEY